MLIASVYQVDVIETAVVTSQGIDIFFILLMPATKTFFSARIE